MQVTSGKQSGRHYWFCTTNQNFTQVSKHTVVSVDSVAKKFNFSPLSGPTRSI